MHGEVRRDHVLDLAVEQTGDHLVGVGPPLLEIVIEAVEGDDHLADVFHARSAVDAVVVQPPLVLVRPVLGGAPRPRVQVRRQFIERHEHVVQQTGDPPVAHAVELGQCLQLDNAAQLLGCGLQRSGLGIGSADARTCQVRCVFAGRLVVVQRAGVHGRRTYRFLVGLIDVVQRLVQILDVLVGLVEQFGQFVLVVAGAHGGVFQGRQQFGQRVDVVRTQVRRAVVGQDDALRRVLIDIDVRHQDFLPAQLPGCEVRVVPGEDLVVAPVDDERLEHLVGLQRLGDFIDVAHARVLVVRDDGEDGHLLRLLDEHVVFVLLGGTHAVFSILRLIGCCARRRFLANRWRIAMTFLP